MSQSSDAEYVTPAQQKKINEMEAEARLLAEGFRLGFQAMPEVGDEFELAGATAVVTSISGTHIFMDVKVPIDNVIIEIHKQLP